MVEKVMLQIQSIESFLINVIEGLLESEIGIHSNYLFE
jgi:hypothetical protein